MLKEMASLERFVRGQSLEHRMLYKGATIKLRMLLFAVSMGKGVGLGLIKPDGGEDMLSREIEEDVLECISARVDMPLP